MDKLFEHIIESEKEITELTKREFENFITYKSYFTLASVIKTKKQIENLMMRKMMKYKKKYIKNLK